MRRPRCIVCGRTLLSTERDICEVCSRHGIHVTILHGRPFVHTPLGTLSYSTTIIVSRLSATTLYLIATCKDAARHT